MKHIIKFKAKRLDNGEWVEGDLLHTETLTFITWFENGFRKLEKVDPSTICQFTGLKDKDGKDIFENDILYDKDSGIASAIKWKRHVCGYVYEKVGMFATVHVYACHTGLLKIIGNKFDRKVRNEENIILFSTCIGCDFLNPLCSFVYYSLPIY